LSIRQFKADKLDITDLKLPNSKHLLFRGDKVDITVKWDLGFHQFRGDELDITD